MKILVKLCLLLLCCTNLFAQKESTLDKAAAAYSNSKYEEAKALYTTLLIEGDDEWNYFIYYRRAHCYYSLLKYEEALSDFKKALRINSKHKDFKYIKGPSFLLMAKIYSEQEEREKSIEYLGYAAKLSNDPIIWNNMGYSQLHLGAYSDALESLNKALELDIDNAYAYSNRSFVYLKLGDFDKAQADIETAFKFDAYNPYAYKYQAMIYLEQQQLDKACEALAEAKHLGYETFGRGRAADAQEVDDLIKEHCTNPKEGE